MTNYTVDQLYGKLERADAAGDTEAAQAIASEIRRVQAAPKADFSDVTARIENAAKPKAPSLQEIARQTYDESPWHERIAISAGGALNSLGRGVGQLVTQDDSAIGRRLQASIDADAPYQEGMHGVTNVVGQALPYLATLPLGGPEAALLSRLPQAGKLARLGAKVGTAAAEGAGYGAAQETRTGESRLENAGWGALGGGVARGALSVAGATGRGLAQTLDPYEAPLIAKAKQAGLKLGAGELSQNPLVKTVISQMERLPFSGGGSRSRANQEAFNRAVGAEIGAPGAARITPEVFADAKTAASREFDRLTAQNALSLDPGAVAGIRAVVNQARAEGGEELGRSLQAQVNDLISRVGPNGKITGGGYQSFDSKLGKLMKVGGEKGHYLGELRDVVRQAYDAGVSPADTAAWQAVRKKWANLKTIEPLVAKDAVGNIPPAQLMGRVTADRAGKARMATDNGGRLGELARIGQRFLKEAPNSGTADRLLVNGVLAGSLYGGQEIGFIDPETALRIGGLLALNRYGLKSANKASNSSRLAALLADQGVGATVRRGAEQSARKLAVPNMPRSEGLDIDIVGGTPIPAAEYRRLVEEERRRGAGY